MTHDPKRTQETAKAKSVVMVGPAKPEAMLNCTIEGDGDTDVVLLVDDFEGLGLPPTDVEIGLPPLPLALAISLLPPPLPRALAILLLPPPPFPLLPLVLVAVLLLSPPPFPLLPLALVAVLLSAVTASAVLADDISALAPDPLEALPPLDPPTAEAVDPPLPDPPDVLVEEAIPPLDPPTADEVDPPLPDPPGVPVGETVLSKPPPAVGDVFDVVSAKERDEPEVEPDTRPALELEDAVEVGANGPATLIAVVLA